MHGAQRLAWLAVCSCALSAMCGRDDAIAPAPRVGAAGACRTEGLLQLRGGSSAGVLEVAEKVAAGEALPPRRERLAEAARVSADVDHPEMRRRLDCGEVAQAQDARGHPSSHANSTLRHTIPEASWLQRALLAGLQFPARLRASALIAQVSPFRHRSCECK